MTTHTIFLVFLAAVVALILAWFQYYLKKTKATKNRPLFTLLRFITWFVLFLLLINPKFIKNTYYTEKPNLILAIDNSLSVSFLGGASEVKNFLAEFQNNPDLNKKFELRSYSFGENLSPLDSLNFNEQQTEIGESVKKLQQIYKGKIAPIVLITDGNQTFGEKYGYLKSQFDLPIYPVVVGDTAHYNDLEITQLNVNRYTFLDHKFPVEVFVNYTGGKEVSKELIIKEGKFIVFRKTLQFSPEKKSQRITALLTSKNSGVKTYSAIIESLENEKNKINNKRKFAIEAIDQKTKILLLAGILHPDIGALKKSMESNEQRSVTLKIIDEKFNLATYQLVVLYQPNASFKNIYEQLEKLKINSFTLTGTQTDYGFLNSIQTDFQKSTGRQTEDYLPLLNKDFEAFQVNDIGFDDFPPLKDQFEGVNVNSNSQIILFQTIQGIKTNDPLLFTVEEQNGIRNAYLFGEGIWKWRAKSFLDSRSFEEFDGFLGKLVQYLGITKKRDRLEINYKSFYNKGDDLTIDAAYFDSNFVFDPRAKLEFKAINKATKEQIERPFLLKNKHYSVNLADLPPGEYQFAVRVKGENRSKSGAFTLVDFEVEKQFMNADLNQLKQIANNKEEQVYFIDKPETLLQDLMQNDAYLPVQKSRETKVSIIDWYYLLLLLLITLAAEWFLRKYNGLI